ncbi:hypothetical protein psyc5s11_07900 [Clostridium gelidum]|uniref:histidine kinase n=1 Tax=Clostridium gelidum TaxID=704125 RepID=A0ABM7T0L7_9CLOT|nr:HAMP domain-containing sensor histidine kinase [Clostridium gelidum]BCZ44723.1 hypothetical protein psyc5s11_07900 [Clostridium gelidum]
MMKAKTAFKNIFLKTAAMFFILYFIVTIGFTAVYYNFKVNESKGKFDSMLDVLEKEINKEIRGIENERLSEGRTEYWTKDVDNQNALNKDICAITELNGDITYLTSSFSKEMFAKTYLYDENFKLIAKSRDLLRVTSFDEKKKSDIDYLNINRYIDLDKYLSEDQKNELFKIYNKKSKLRDDPINVRGFINGAEIIPEEITIDESESGDEDTKREDKIKTYKFNTQEVEEEGLRKININTSFDFNWEIHHNRDIYNSDNSNDLYRKNFQRYNNLKEYNEEEMRSLINSFNEKGASTKSNKSEIFGKVEYDYIDTLIGSVNNHKYYLHLKTDYYPWDDVLPKAMPLYIISFIMVLAMTLILSKGLYKTYEKQAVLEKNRRELTSAIAHELKTPLGIIRTYGEGLKEKIAEDKRDYYLDVIIDETYKMDTMVLEMLYLSKLEAKAYELKRETFCINDLVEGIIKKNEKLFNDKSIQVNYINDKKYDVDADYTRIEQVINNLLSNAIYHTEEKKTINIRLDNEKFTIENQGEHIPKDKINLIWDAFYRVDNSRDRSERRTGIGLAIVKNILQLHNMEFGVENTNIGVEFWFKI